MVLTELEPGPRLARLDRLLPADVPTRPRALAVLDGVLGGRAWADDPDEPSALLVVEESDGTVYAGGDVTPEAAHAALAVVRPASRELIFGFSGARDPLRQLVPTEPFWSGHAIDFTDRVPPDGERIDVERGLPDAARAVPLEPALLPKTEWYADTLRAFGSAERWAELSLGFAVMIGDEMVAECLAGPRSRGLLEMGVVTREAHRRRGYGTLVSRLTARACEARGDRVWWNSNADNAPSLAIARRLGFRSERRYELVACHASAGLPGGWQ